MYAEAKEPQLTACTHRTGAGTPNEQRQHDAGHRGADPGEPTEREGSADGNT